MRRMRRMRVKSTPLEGMAAVGALSAVPVGEVEDASGSQRPAKRVRVHVGSVRASCSADMQCELWEALVSARSERETWTDKSWQQRPDKVDKSRHWGAASHGGWRRPDSSAIQAGAGDLLVAVGTAGAVHTKDNEVSTLNPDRLDMSDISACSPSSSGAQTGNSPRYARRRRRHLTSRWRWHQEEVG